MMGLDRMDQTRALLLAAEAFDLWQSERLHEAEQRYRDAISAADAKHYRTPTFTGSTRLCSLA